MQKSILDNRQTIELARQAHVMLARENYKQYLRYVYEGMWTDARHLSLVCETMDDIIDGKIKRVMLFLPPRHGKSMTVTKSFPSYFLGRFPDKRVITASYSDVLADEFGEANRAKIVLYGKEIFGIELSRSQASKTNWNILGRDGGMLATSVGGGVTGKGADLLIIDDPIRNRQDAESETYRAKLLREYQSTLYTRLHPNAIVIIILTRWHEADLAAKLIRPDEGEPEDWKIISLPAICDEENDPLGRKIGEALWPEHGFDEVWAERTRLTVGSYAWSSLYQQKPTPAGGSVFKREWMTNEYERLPDGATIIQTWDHSFTKSDVSAKCAGLVLARRGSNYYLEDAVNEKMEFVEQLAAMRTMTAKHPKARAKVVENKANGPAVISTMQREIPGVIGFEPHGGKEERARSVTPVFEAGNFFFKKGQPWVHDIIEQLVSFPNGEFKDAVDALTQGIIYLEEALGESGGLVYRAFAADEKAYQRDNMKDIPFIREKRTASINIGVALGGPRGGTAFVASYVSEDYNEAAILGTERIYANMPPDRVAESLLDFLRDIKREYKQDATYVYCSSTSNDDYAQFRALEEALHESSYDSRIMEALENTERDRIDMINALMGRKRFWIRSDDEIMKTALVESMWDVQKNRMERVKNGISDILALEAMEHSLERYLKHFITEQ